MATITDPQVIAFVNQELRPAMDRMISAYRTLEQLTADYAAKGLGPLVAGTQTLQNEYVADGAINADGSKGDGRTPLLGYDVDNCIAQCNALLAWLQASAQSAILPALTKPSVNNQPVF